MMSQGYGTLAYKISLNAFELPSLTTLIDYLLKFALLILMIPVFVPFAPKMPAPGLDSSWALGLNQAVAQGLAFGKDIIFTLGPYSSVYTKTYHPATDALMLWGSFYLVLSYWLNLVILMRNAQWRWIVAFAVLLFGMIYARDSLFFSYPLLVGLNCCKALNSGEGNPKPSMVLIMMMLAPFGLLALVKGSLFILITAVAGLCALLFLCLKEQKLAVLCLIIPLISMLLFWVIAGQSPVHLPAYIYTSLALASGFSEAMALEGNQSEIISYLVAAAAILLYIVQQRKTPATFKWFALVLFTLFLFLSFKAGFTRHFGHSFITGTSILIAAFILPFLFQSRMLIPVMILSLFTATYIDGQHTKISLLNNFTSTYSSSWHGFKSRLDDRDWARKNYEFTMNYLSNQASLPALKGTTDIYSYEQSYLIAAHLNWAPRPVFQSYSVFTAGMAEKNKNYLLQKNKPDHILFKLQAIDGRIPSLDDGISWPELLNYYQPVQLSGDFLVLDKKSNQNQPKSMILLQNQTHQFGEHVRLTTTKAPLFVKILIKPTLWGRIINFLFKPDPLFINIELHNGSSRHYRLIAQMAKSGFLLSPLIEDTAEFGLLYSHNTFLDNKYVKSITITSSQNNTRQWHHHYVIQGYGLPNLES
jgi:hypothetical protein